MAGLRETWPNRPDFVIDGKTSRRSHDRAEGADPLQLVSAFATASRLVLDQVAVPHKAGELTAIPVLLARLAEVEACFASATLDAARAHQAVRSHWAEVVQALPACR